MVESRSSSQCLYNGDEALYECKATPELGGAFTRKAVKFVCSENDVLFSCGEPGRCVFLILAGEIGLFLPLSSMNGMAFCAKAGAFIGLPAAFSNEAYSMTAVAHNGAEVAVMSRADFCDLVAADPILSLDVLRILAAETRAARIAIVNAGMERRSRQQA